MVNKSHIPTFQYPDKTTCFVVCMSQSFSCTFSQTRLLILRRTKIVHITKIMVIITIIIISSNSNRSSSSSSGGGGGGDGDSSSSSSSSRGSGVFSSSRSNRTVQTANTASFDKNYDYHPHPQNTIQNYSVVLNNFQLMLDNCHTPASKLNARISAGIRSIFWQRTQL